ncbi:MAG: nitroreductase family protein [Clostridia bacterium]|nr:nitroreductase family protein [Clostridia bacterium]
MNYSVLIQNRKTFREFTDKKVSLSSLKTIRTYYRNSVQRLFPELKTQLYFFGAEAKAALEGAAGYNQYLIGAPQYMVLLSEKHDKAYLNAGYIMEDLILKLVDMGLDSCYLTFTDSERVKTALGIDSELEVAAIAAFGYGKKSAKRLQVNIHSMSEVDIAAKRQYMEPKRSIYDLAFLGTWGNTHRLDEYIGFYDDILWEALYAVTLSPSYLNRQAYGFLIQDGSISLISRPDDYSTPIDTDLSLGIALLHFTAVAREREARIHWRFDHDVQKLNLPKDHHLIASSSL